MWTGADMTAVGELVLVLGLLVSAHCEVRARDPEVEEEEELGGRPGGGRPGGGGGGGGLPPYFERLHRRATDTPPLGERGSQARLGNWCPFVQERAVTVAVACGTEMYTIKSQSPCPSRSPDCQPLVMYKLSTRPIYKQKQVMNTALLWRCCPGHGGPKCEDTVSDGHLDSGSAALIGRPEAVTSKHAPGVPLALQQQHADPNREQNDHHMPLNYAADHQHNSTGSAQHTGDSTDHAPSTGPAPHADHTQRDYERQPRGGPQYKPDPTPSSHQEALMAQLIPQMLVLVTSQLQPTLDQMNLSLERLRQQVGVLAYDVAQLKSDQLGAELDETTEDRLEAKLDHVSQNIREVQRQVESQRADMDNRLHSQHAMLHYNLTNFKMDIDMKLKRHQKLVQVSLQAVNATVEELKQEQDQTSDYQLEDQLLPPILPQPSATSALWEAIERLDNKVVNNTVKVGGLMEDMEVTFGDVQQLRRDFKDLGKQINQTARNSQIQFMETGLEVEAAKEVVLRRVSELAGNLSQQGERMQEMDVDLDYVYSAYYKQNSSGDCDCKALWAGVRRLERGVANVTELANENRMTLDETNEGGAGQWGGASDWEPVVEALQRHIQQVKESLTSEQTRIRTLDRDLTQLNTLVKVGQAEISGLKEADRKLVEDVKVLSGYFNSLLNDAIRHTDVLEMLLGEEVLEFLEWPMQDQEAHSIPALKEQLRHLQDQLTGHDLSITVLQGNRPANRDEVPSADQPSSSHLLPDDWLPGNMRRSGGGAPTRERQLLLHPERRRPEHGGDGSDLWNLEKTVEELASRVHQLEEKHRNVSATKEAPPGGGEAKLQEEVMWLKRGLEEHLRIFKNVFSNADVLAASDDTLELDKLWQLVKNRDGKKEKKRGGGREASGRGGHHRSRRDSSGAAPVPFSQSEDPLLVMSGSPVSVSNGVIVFKTTLNRDQFHSDTTDTFTAPLDGIYLFALTLDLRPGPAHVVLRRGSSGAVMSLQRQEVTEAGRVTGVGQVPLSAGEEVRLELKEGSWAESEDNVFTVLLLHRTT